MTIDIERQESSKLQVGKTPARLASGSVISYYILTCEHGTTQLHDPHQYDNDAEVVANLVKEHHVRLEDCECQPA